VTKLKELWLLLRLALIVDLVPKKTRNRVVCAVIGHSRIVSVFWGEVSCGRCEQKIGDTLMGVYPLDKCVVIGHDCDKCREIAKTFTWRDTLGTPDPGITA
jgi:hypothetical protein